MLEDLYPAHSLRASRRCRMQAFNVMPFKALESVIWCGYRTAVPSNVHLGVRSNAQQGVSHPLSLLSSLHAGVWRGPHNAHVSAPGGPRDDSPLR